MKTLGPRLIITIILGATASFAGIFDLPKPAPPDRYGTILIDRAAASGPSKAVVFSHWRHRARYSCRVCHFELGFELQVNASEITEADNRHGLFCGACHDGTEAFPVTDKAQCSRCHAGKIHSEKKAFKNFSENLPKAAYGNEVDWVQAKEILKPRFALSEEEKSLDFDKELLLQARWFNIPPAVFPHTVHAQFLDCANCHPDVFNIKQKTTEHFEMRFILEGKFCGACHLNVAFPLDDCMRCHPGMRKNQ
jgi:c(7)-type cytochrome triheme protein